MCWVSACSQPKILGSSCCEEGLYYQSSPALPGKYDGIDAIKRAYDDYHKGKLEHDTTGVMIHHVISEVDRDTPIVVRQIKCKTPETLEELTDRIHVQEHELIVEGTALAISNLWKQRSESSETGSN